MDTLGSFRNPALKPGGSAASAVTGDSIRQEAFHFAALKEAGGSRRFNADMEEKVTHLEGLDAEQTNALLKGSGCAHQQLGGSCPPAPAACFRLQALAETLAPAGLLLHSCMQDAGHGSQGAGDSGGPAEGAKAALHQRAVPEPCASRRAHVRYPPKAGKFKACELVSAQKRGS